jgi:hypothetical protein
MVFPEDAELAMKHDAATNSPQSQKETDGCTVINNTMKEIIKTIPAITLFSRLKFIITSNLE